MSTTRHLNWPSALGVWAAICFAAALSVPRQGMGGREFPVTGYSIGWGNRRTFVILSSFGLFAVIAIALGTTIHFIQFEPRYPEP